MVRHAGWQRWNSRRPRTSKPTGRQPHHALSTAFVRDVAQAGRYCDGDGLYLDVQPTGTRSWVQQLVIRGRRCELGFGGFPLVPLKDARAAALANRRLARAGGDPLAEKRRLKSMPSFAAAAEAVLARMRPGWRDPKHGKDWLSSRRRSLTSYRTRSRPRTPRSDLFERRRRLMDDWSAHVVGDTRSAGRWSPIFGDRANALVRVGWTQREAEWLALVCLHSGVFLRSQYLAFIGRTNPALANRLVRRCRKHAVEQPWHGSRLRICRTAAQHIYRAIGAEHLRHHRPAAPEVVLRRLLSLDYVLEHPDAAWLPTEDEKVNALTAAG